MSESASQRPEVRRLLIVEDEYLIATDLAYSLEGLGINVVGPAASVEEALEIVDTTGAQIDAALLDINVRGQPVYPVADALAARFTTGYDAVAIPPAYAKAPRCEKPIDKQQLMRWLSEATASKFRGRVRTTEAR
jgi:CheY-like chemotaxis protein